MQQAAGAMPMWPLVREEWALYSPCSGCPYAYPQLTSASDASRNNWLSPLPVPRATVGPELGH